MGVLDPQLELLIAPWLLGVGVPCYSAYQESLTDTTAQREVSLPAAGAQVLAAPRPPLLSLLTDNMISPNHCGIRKCDF